MALLDFLKSWRTNSKIRGLETQLRGRPAPQVYLQLADAYIAAGNHTKAVQILKLGASRFPSAPEITRRQADAEKFQRESERRRLQDKIQTHPNPILYARLAELYKADKDADRTIQICHAGIKAFPRYSGTYLVLGQIHAERQQWPEAMAQLEKSVERDKYNYMALKLLAQVYMQLGRLSDAASKCEEILYFAPGDDAIKELLKQARNDTDESPTKASTKADAAQDSQQVAAPDRTNKPAQAKPDPDATGKDAILSNGLAHIKTVEGILGAIIVDQFGLVVASDIGSVMDEGLAGALITNVYRTTSQNSDLLGVGSFEESEIQGEDGTVHIARIGEMILAVYATSKVKMGLLQKHVHSFAASVIDAN